MHVPHCILSVFAPSKFPVILDPAVYPGMKELSWQSSNAVYTYVYQTPSRTQVRPESIARQLWLFINDMREYSLEHSRNQHEDGDGTEVLVDTGSGWGRFATKMVERAILRSGVPEKVATAPLSGLNTKAHRSVAKKMARNAAAAANAAAARNGSWKFEGTRRSARGGASGADMSQKKEKEEAELRRSESEEYYADEHAGASSDAIVALVYSVTEKTNSHRQAAWDGTEWDERRFVGRGCGLQVYGVRSLRSVASLVRCEVACCVRCAFSLSPYGYER